jgi:hypothetical protein
MYITNCFADIIEYSVSKDFTILHFVIYYYYYYYYDSTALLFVVTNCY